MDTELLNGEEDGVANKDITQDGDVILIVGDENIRLRVYSQYLSSASKIFSAMFGPDWSEGRKLSKESPKEIPLPEDDADAMRTICCIIHHRNDLVSDYLRADKVLQIAIAVDKYDLNIALKYASLEWLKADPLEDLEDSVRLLAAAYLFKNHDAFMAQTKTLIYDHCESYMEFFRDKTISQILPPETFYLLEERRTRLRLEIYEMMDYGRKEEVCKCGWGKFRRELLKELVLEYSPLAMLEIPLSDIIAKVESVPNEKAGTGNKGCSEKSLHELPCFRSTLRGRLNDAKEDAVTSISDVKD